jgi:CheY-like chemotaxis protein
MVQCKSRQRATISSATILIVENEALIRIELAAQLADMGLRVLVACDADEAITVLDAHRDISVLLTDLTMPGSMDGVRLAHYVRNRWPPIKIVATSGRQRSGVCDLPSGAKFFAKPYSPATLRRAIASLVRDTGARRAA